MEYLFYLVKEIQKESNMFNSALFHKEKGSQRPNLRFIRQDFVVDIKNLSISILSTQGILEYILINKKEGLGV